MSWSRKFLARRGANRKPLDDDTSIPQGVKTALHGLLDSVPQEASVIVETSGHVDPKVGYAHIEVKINTIEVAE